MNAGDTTEAAGTPLVVFTIGLASISGGVLGPLAIRAELGNTL